jgi:hypothetical protein
MRPMGVLWAAALAAAVPAGGVAGSELPRVITHTRDYCEALSARAAELRQGQGSMPAEAELLAAEGDRLCAQGQIRPGIMRLRRAIMLLREGEAAQR